MTLTILVRMFLDGRNSVLLLSVILFPMFFAGCVSPPPPIRLSVNGDGILQIPSERGDVDAEVVVLNDSEKETLSKVAYSSLDGRKVYALLRVPKINGKAVSNAPAAVFMPGAGVAKEGGNIGVGKALASAGFVVITIDQRGVGETSGAQKPLQEDFNAYLSGGNVSAHLQVYDYLRAFDYLRSLASVDPGRIIFAGESHGGRIAIIAAGVEKRAKGVMVISSAGYGFAPSLEIDRRKDVFLSSIDPDSYLPLLPPRKIVFLHSSTDNGIPIQLAQRSFAKAGEPKQFVLISCPYHGYCNEISGQVGGVAKDIAG